MTYFLNTYEEARAAFLEKAKDTGGILRSYAIPSRTDKDLFVDTLHLRQNKKKLLIMTSGIHGIEGFTGSALQNEFLGRNSFPCDVLVIHGINPYGFRHFRRVTEKNIDLNRNFDTGTELFDTKNPGYDSLHHFLNPGKRLSRLNFYLSAVKNILKSGVDSLRRAILQGQYQYPDGIFFGGKSFEPQVGIIENIVNENCLDYEDILLVDIHTGYGERGRLHLFGDRSPYIDQAYMNEVFRDLPVDYGADKDFYAVTGGFTVFLAKLFHRRARFAGVVFEFGTIDSQKLSGSLESLYRMINEKHDPENFRELFYPEDPQWRESVLNQFNETLARII